MKYLRIEKSLIDGMILPSGSKNVVLPLIACSLFSEGESVFYNVPDILDVKVMLEILKILNVKVTFKNKILRIDKSNLIIRDIPFSLVSKIRASYYFLPILFSYLKECYFTYPGGCSFQERPIDYHLKAFEKFGVSSQELNDNIIKFNVVKLIGAVVKFDKPSVGATINAIMMGLISMGKTEIINPSLSLEVREFINFIKKSKGKINIINNRIYVEKSYLSAVEFNIPPDPIEGGTYALIGLSNGNLAVFNIDKDECSKLFDLFKKLNLNFCYDSLLYVKKSIVDFPIRLKLLNQGGMHTDLGPLLCAFLLQNKKISIIEDTIYPERLSYIYELNKMGAKIKVINHKIVIFPYSNYRSACLNGRDLRGTMSLILASIISEKKQLVSGYEHLIRGYDNIVYKLKSIGVNIDEEE